MARLGLLWHVLQLESVRIRVRSDYYVLPVLLQLVLLMWKWLQLFMLAAILLILGVGFYLTALWIFESL